MKGCDDCSSAIQLYLDAELSGPDMEDFRAHLEECEACRAQLEEEERLSALLRRSRPLYSAPDALRKQVAQTIESFDPTVTQASVRLRKRIITDLRRPAQPRAQRGHHWGALVASFVLVAAILLVTPGIVRQARANSYIETAVAAHRSFLEGNLPLEVQSGSPSVVTAWFAGKVPFTFRLPNSVEQSGQAQVYRLTGGRLVNYKDGYAALVAYQMQQQKITLLVASNKSAVSAGGQIVPSGAITFHYTKQSGFNVITWSNHGLTYALVSSLPGSGRQSCLVCHQSMGDSSHFSAHR